MKIDFYVLEATNSQKSLFFACQLVEKLYTDDSPSIHILTGSAEEAERLDALLWTYREDSFLPHGIVDAATTNPPAITISHGDVPSPKTQAILMNLSKAVPPSFQSYPHLIEIVFNDPDVQQLARERFKLYRQQGFDINTIKLKENES